MMTVSDEQYIVIYDMEKERYRFFTITEPLPEMDPQDPVAIAQISKEFILRYEQVVDAKAKMDDELNKFICVDPTYYAD